MLRTVNAPFMMVRSIFELDTNALRKAGVTVLALDIDNTLGRAGCSALDARTVAWLQMLSLQFKLVLVTNSKRSLSALGAMIPVGVIQPHGLIRRKPHPSIFRHILLVTGVDDLKHVAMVGDKLHFDVLPAVRLGMLGVLVNPIGKDAFGERLIFLRRPREKLTLRRLHMARPK